jgi:hypothetical protein
MSEESNDKTAANVLAVVGRICYCRQQTEGKTSACFENLVLKI